MASFKIFFIIAALAVFVFPLSLATEFVVGDEKGWSLDFDYQGCREGISSRRYPWYVVFKYKAGVHNVMRVNGSEFQNCEASNVIPLTTGNDVITLATPGKKWYICGVPTHCATRHMKLSITVLARVGSPDLAPSPNSPTPTPAPSAASSSTSYGLWVFVMLSFVAMLLV